MGRTINNVFLWSAFAALVIPCSSYGQARPTLEETAELIQRTVQHSDIVLTGTRTFPGSAKFTYEKFDVSGCTVTVVTRHDMWGPVPRGTVDSFAFDLKNVDPGAVQVVGFAKSDVSLLKVQVTVPVTTTTFDRKTGTTMESRSNIFEVLFKDRAIAERIQAAFSHGAQLCGARNF
jgi:hypothetical protein